MSNLCTTLTEILRSIEKYPSIHNNIGKLWKDIFQLQNKPDFEVYIKDAEFRSLIYKARLEAEEYGGKEKNPFLKHFDTFIKIFQDLSLQSSVQKIKQDEFSNALVGIESCAFALQKSDPQPDVSKEELDEFIVEIEELFQQADKIDFPSELKTQILDNIHFIKKVVVDFKINGSKDIRRAIEANMGQILLNHKTMSETKGGAEYISAAIGLMSKINTLFSFYHNSQGLYSGAVQFFKSLT
ncbi:hypothetical protein [Paenibacillus polymyxa]|uniref:hypothetical protein n=1 Tax=Paenibacillus polymyxa TaxID=1406 RepID=UPI002378D83A|nr:hypothetical protein [Paenibacillus polymyxa]WDM22321.1 hypothetical protein J4I02_01210 [Paenibacillus polymyxa]